jgi:signal transduction histidine kinase
MIENETTELQLIKANRLISLSSSINRLILRAQAEKEILEGICSISVQEGDFRMSWFGLANNETGYLDPICCSGHVEDYFNYIPKISFIEVPEGMGPAGLAYRERTLKVNNDIADVSDERYDLWRDAALARGYRSSIGIPIYKKDKLYGVFSLYHSQPFFFNDSEQQLLQDIGENLTFSINNLDAEREKEILRNELNTAYNNLSDAHTQLDQFTYRASHDLRGPIASLLGLCVVGKMEFKELPAALNLLNKLEATAIGLDKTLRRLITALDIKHQQVEVSRILFPELFSKIKDRFKDDSLCLTTEIEDGVSLNSDFGLLLIALENIVENSVQHKKPQMERCNVKIAVEQLEKKSVKFRIIDNGVGLATENSDRIFEMFFKGSEYTNGPGIGLYVVRNIMSKLGGRVTLRSSTSDETEFEIILPNL